MTSRPPQIRVTPALVLSCLLALLCVGCASSSVAPEGTVAEPVAAERICRGAATAGSKLRRTTCHSAAEWAIIDARTRAREEIQDEFFRRASEGASLGPGPSFPSATSPRL